MTINLVDFKERITALYKEAFAALTIDPESNVDAEEHVGYVSEKIPYVTLRTGDILIEGDGEEVDVYTITIVSEVYAAFVSENAVPGEADERIDRWIIFFIKYFNERELLQSVARPTAPDNLDYARIISSAGYRQTRTGGATPEERKLTTFTHELRATDVIEQVYL